MRLRFNIRELFWLMTLIALGVAWWIDRTRLAGRYTTLKQSTSTSMVLSRVSSIGWPKQRARSAFFISYLTPVSIEAARYVFQKSRQQ
jgi:hypothetical protein